MNTATQKQIEAHSATALIRALGKAGVSFAGTKAILADAKIKAADATIRIQLSAGHTGQRGDPAKLDKDTMGELMKIAAQSEPAAGIHASKPQVKSSIRKAAKSEPTAPKAETKTTKSSHPPQPTKTHSRPTVSQMVEKAVKSSKR